MSVVLATDTVQRAHAALAHGDRDEALATCDRFVRWTVSDGLPFGGIYDGIREVENYFSELARHFSSLLVTLTERRDRVQARGTLLSDVWAIDAEIASRTVDTHVKRLRDKLGTAGRFIETVRGVGYRFSETPSAEE